MQSRNSLPGRAAAGVPPLAAEVERGQRVGWVELAKPITLSPQTPSHGGWREEMGFARLNPSYQGATAAASLG
jgi:hypothetical protein